MMGLTSASTLRYSEADLEVLGIELKIQMGFVRVMQDLRLDNNKLAGPLPYMWTAEDSFPKLQTLQLQNNQLDGPLAQSWGRIYGLRALRVLLLSHNLLQGPLPGDWAAPGTFQQLFMLKIDNNMLTGALPSVRQPFLGMKGHARG
jgi:hypothetical protein